MLKSTRTFLLLATCAAAVPLTGCATGKGKGDTSYVARDVATLYSAAKRTMDSGDYEQAAKLFDEVERQHPYSVWARRAQLMSAFNYYLAKKYSDAVSSAQRFVTIHPGNAEAPYAQYLIGMSYYEQMEDVSRDQSTTQSALSAFGELIRRYPDSRYASDARERLALLNDHLAGKEMEIGRYYQRSANWLAATYRFREVVDKYPTTTHTAEALERLTETYLALGVPDEAFKAASVLGRNYPDTYWYRQSLRLLQKERDKNGTALIANAGQKVEGASSLPAPTEGKSKRPSSGGATHYPGRPILPPPPPSPADNQD